ncbi:PKD domain-containing protein [Halorhabdus salina]|uniref:PKD domain-containing protein n=1 Tax=Halorhabdus salina TaxID=2750670 RepID=UPI0015EFD9FB|nr:PKD domain-containing protein [Halorhabdus salina]
MSDDTRRSAITSRPRTFAAVIVVLAMLTVGWSVMGIVGAAGPVVSSGTTFTASDSGPTITITEELELEDTFYYPDGETVDLSPHAYFNSSGASNVTVESITGTWTNVTTHDVSNELEINASDKQAVRVKSSDMDSLNVSSVDATSTDADVVYDATSEVTLTITGQPANAALRLDEVGGGTLDSGTTDGSGEITLSLSSTSGDRAVTVVDDENPTADAGSDQTVDEGTSFSFDGTGSSDDNGVVSYEWDVDDDSSYELTGSLPSHSYSSTGTKTVTLRVTDDVGNTDTDTLEITVESSDEGGTVGPPPGTSVGDTDDGDDADDGTDDTTPDQEPSVTVEQDRDGGTVATVTNATSGSTVVIDNSTTGGAAIGQSDNLTVDSLRTNVTTDREFWLNVSTYSENLQTATGDAPDETVEQAAHDFENETGTVAAGYVRVEHKLDESDVSNATFSFSVRQAYLDDLGVGPTEVSLYRQHNDAWSALPTSFVGENATHYRFEGVSPGYSVFALGTSAPKFDVIEVTLAETIIKSNETTTLTATIENRGNADGSHTLSLTSDGQDLGSETVAVAGKSTATVEFSVERPVGEWTIALNGDTVETLTVEQRQQVDDETPTETATPTESTTETTTATESPIETAAQTPSETSVQPPTTTTTEDTGGVSILWLAGGGLGVAVLALAVLALARRRADGED